MVGNAAIPGSMEFWFSAKGQNLSNLSKMGFSQQRNRLFVCH